MHFYTLSCLIVAGGSIFLNFHKLGGHDKITLEEDCKSMLKMGRGASENKMERWIFVSIYKSIVCTRPLNKGGMKIFK